METIKGRAGDGKRTLETAKETGGRALEDAKSMSDIIESLPTDVDDEILQAAEAVKEGTRADAEGYMDSVVNTQLEDGKSVLSEASDMSREQIANNKEVISAFNAMDGIGDFGKGSRATGLESVNQSINEFNQLISENDTSASEAESEIKNQRDTISGLF